MFVCSKCHKKFTLDEEQYDGSGMCGACYLESIPLPKNPPFDWVVYLMIILVLAFWAVFITII